MSPLADLARVFLRLGVTGFGGPAAHIAMMRDEFVSQRGWFDDAAFVDAATVLIACVAAVLLVTARASTTMLVVAGVALGAIRLVTG